MYVWRMFGFRLLVLDVLLDALSDAQLGKQSRELSDELFGEPLVHVHMQ